MRKTLTLFVLVAVLSGCGLFDRGESTLTRAQATALRTDTGAPLDMQNAKALEELEKRLGAKIVGLEQKLDGSARVTTASPAEEASVAFLRGYKQGAEVGASIAPGAGWPTAIASIIGGLVVGAGGAVGVLRKKRRDQG